MKALSCLNYGSRQLEFVYALATAVKIWKRSHKSQASLTNLSDEFREKSIFFKMTQVPGS